MKKLLNAALLMGPLALTPLALGACQSDNTLVSRNDNSAPDVRLGDVSGRVCDPSDFGWLEGATVYANIADEAGYIAEVRTTSSDGDGYWTLTDLPNDRTITVYVQYGDEILETHDVVVNAKRATRLPEPTCFDPQTLSVGVVTGDYDNFDRVLDAMGFTEYTLIDGTDKALLLSFLRNPEAMAEYDLLYFNGGHVEQGVIYNTDDPNDETVAEVLTNIRHFVEDGNQLYASDWAYDVIDQIWPGRITFLGAQGRPDSAQLGTTQQVQATVSDYALSEFLEDEDRLYPIWFDLPVWPPVVNVSETSSVHLSAEVEYLENSTYLYLPNSPLLASFNVGTEGGKVVFSSFRLVANNDDELIRLVQYVMFVL